MVKEIKCACGCGRTITPKFDHKYRPARFIQGHSSKGTKHRQLVLSPDEIPSGMCECGCGQQTAIAHETWRARRHFKGYPLPYLRGHTKKQLRENNHRWKGGRIKDYGGYIRLYMPDDPRADCKGYVFEHRLIWEQANGKSLEPNQNVHHINGIKDDNRPENLVALSKADHTKEHASEKGKKGAAARWHKK